MIGGGGRRSVERGAVAPDDGGVNGNRGERGDATKRDCGLMLVVVYGLLAVGVVGHGLMLIGAVNRLHGLAIPKPWFKAIELLLAGPGLAAPAALAWSIGVGQFAHWVDGDTAAPAPPGPSLAPWTAAYFYFAAAVLLTRLPAWLQHRLRAAPAAVRSDSGRLLDLARTIGGRPTGDRATRLLAALPGNEIFQLDLRELELELPRLPAALDGFTLWHLSDLHFSGRIGVEYFQAATEAIAARPADAIFVTGDILDAVECFDWLPGTLGRLDAPCGRYFVLGNHDLRLPDPSRLRRRLEELGWIDLGGRLASRRWNGADVELAGNELPWFAPAPDWPLDDAPDAAFRLALLHSPDQFEWACRRRVDLALAGHTHGGQVRLPWIGPVFAPSLYGVRFTGGVFTESGTVMSVSRGLSGLEPLRWNCPPEATRITLRRPAAKVAEVSQVAESSQRGGEAGSAAAD